MVIVPGALNCVQGLKQAGYICICVTNQPDYARGTRSLENITAMNARVLAELPLDDLFVCLHDNADNCACRKPKPGMLLEAARKWGIDLTKSWMVGDRAGDIEAGHAAGCRTIFLDQGYDRPKAIKADFVCENITMALNIILSAP